MLRKIVMLSALVLVAIAISACDEVGYNCEGAGTCDEPRGCYAESGSGDYYWVVDGTRYDPDEAAELTAYCNDDVTTDGDYVCDGDGTCDSPTYCVNTLNGDYYYEAEGDQYDDYTALSEGCGI